MDEVPVNDTMKVLAEFLPTIDQIERAQPHLADGEAVSAIPIPICRCGEMLYVHDIHRRGAPRPADNCPGFVLDRLRWQIITYREVPLG